MDKQYAGAHGMLSCGVQIACRKLRRAVEEQDWKAVSKLTSFLEDLNNRSARYREGGEHEKPNVDITGLEG